MLPFRASALYNYHSGRGRAAEGKSGAQGKDVMLSRLKGVPGIAATKPGIWNNDKNFTLH